MGAAGGPRLNSGSMTSTGSDRLGSPRAPRTFREIGKGNLYFSSPKAPRRAQNPRTDVTSTTPQTDSQAARTTEDASVKERKGGTAPRPFRSKSIRTARLSPRNRPDYMRSFIRGVKYYSPVVALIPAIALAVFAFVQLLINQTVSNTAQATNRAFLFFDNATLIPIRRRLMNKKFMQSPSTLRIAVIPLAAICISGLTAHDAISKHR